VPPQISYLHHQPPTGARCYGQQACVCLHVPNTSSLSRALISELQRLVRSSICPPPGAGLRLAFRARLCAPVLCAVRVLSLQALTYGSWPT
jgi:hypothetical protein